MPFRDRADAGHRLAAELENDLEGPAVVLALPRGGVPVAVPVAEAFGAPCDVLVARKLGAPGHPEYGIGAIAEGGVQVLRDESIAALGLRAGDLAPTIAREQEELARRVERYRGDRPLPVLVDRTAVIVDDGLATGVTAEAAVHAARRAGAAGVVLAVPVCAPSTAARLSEFARVVCVECPPNFRAVGEWYDDFDQTSDETVIALLARTAGSRTGEVGGAERAAGAEGAAGGGVRGHRPVGGPIEREDPGGRGGAAG